jgi:SRSO17 transposase
MPLPISETKVDFYAMKYKKYFLCGTRSSLGRCQEYLKGLFHDCKSNIERMQERIVDSIYQNLQHFISHSPWDWRGVMDEVSRQMADSFALLPEPCGLILDESGWEKSGKKSVGVSRQYIGNVGKVSNGQVGVFGALCKGDKVGLVGSRLYLPKEWTDDPARCDAAGIPKSEQPYRTKPELAMEIIKDLVGNVNYDWVGGDAQYGNSPTLRHFLEEKGKTFVLDVGEGLGVYLSNPEPYVPAKEEGRGRTPTRHKSGQTPILLKNLILNIPDGQWQALTHRRGAKGPLRRQAVLLDNWVWDADNGDKAEALQLLISRELDGSEVKFSLCHQPHEPMTIQDALYRQMQRYWVERAFQDVKEQLGLHQYQVRSWIAWYHHVVLTMMALHFILQTRIEQKQDLPLLSCPDVKIMLAKTLSNKLNTQRGIKLAIQKRHQQRQADINRYKNYS